MRLEKVQKLLTEKGYHFAYAEEDGVGSIDFTDRGLSYHIWEFQNDDGSYGAETNLMHAGHMEDISGDYEDQICDTLKIFGNRQGI